jgi:hypothetical protein
MNVLQVTMKTLLFVTNVTDHAEIVLYYQTTVLIV